MNKLLIVIVFIVFCPIYVFAVSNTDIYSQQNISGTFIESGYADTLLQKNGRNTLIDITARNIINYILDNTDPNTAKILSINMPADIQLCDDEYNFNIEGGMNIDLADEILHSCRETLYTRNLAYIIKATTKVSKGSYKILLENIFKEHTNEFLSMKKFNIDEFINKMAVYNLLSFDGKPFYDSVTDIKMEDIKCENNHTRLNVIDENTKKPVSEFNINGRDFYIAACLNKNTNSYFKYIMLFVKNNDVYTLYERLPVFLNYYSSFNQGYDKNQIIINHHNTRLSISDELDDHTSLVYNYMLFRKGTYLLNFAIKHDNSSEYIFKDNSEDKYIITPLNISLKLYKDMVEKYCKDNNDVCKDMQIEKMLPISSSPH